MPEVILDRISKTIHKKTVLIIQAVQVGNF